MSKTTVYVVVRRDVEDLENQSNMYGFCGVASTPKAAYDLLDEYLKDNYSWDTEEELAEFEELYDVIEQPLYDGEKEMSELTKLQETLEKSAIEVPVISKELHGKLLEIQNNFYEECNKNKGRGTSHIYQKAIESIVEVVNDIEILQKILIYIDRTMEDNEFEISADMLDIILEAKLYMEASAMTTKLKKEGK